MKIKIVFFIVAFLLNATNIQSANESELARPANFYSINQIKSETYLEQAYSKYQNAEYQEALNLVNLAINADTKNFEAYYLRGLINAKLNASFSLIFEDFNKYLQNNPEQKKLAIAYRTMALCCAKAKDYTKAIEYYNYLLDNFLAENMDYLNLGKCFYNIKDYKNADTTFATFNTLQPDNIQGFIWRARTKSNIDLKDSLGFNITGYAVQLFEGVIQKTQVDTVKFIKERFESFDYLAFYHYSQFSRDQKLKFEAEKALNYYIRMRSTNPNDEKILLVKPLIETLRTKIK